MSAQGFSSAGGAGSRTTAMGGCSAEGLDKIDMSLDDIIRLNRREQKTRKPGALKLQANARLLHGRKPGAPLKGGGATRLGICLRKVPPPVGRRRGQGVITGLAARRTAALRKGMSPMNRSAMTQKPRTLLRRAASYRHTDAQRWPLRHPDTQRGPAVVVAAAQRHIHRRTPVPAPQAQRAARQATFLFRRGLKVQAQVQSPVTVSAAALRTRPWRTSTASVGILTISIDNPSARTQPEPPSAWSLHPPVPSPPRLKEEERKPPKGVALQFDINSVGKQTTMTLNERFRILKERRAATAVQGGRGSRFVTVG